MSLGVFFFFNLSFLYNYYFYSLWDFRDASQTSDESFNIFLHLLKI